MSIDQKTEQHIEETLNKLRAIYVEAATRIDALQGDEKIPATKLAIEIAESRNMSGPQLYPTLLFLFKDYPGVTISKGAHGGIRKTKVNPAPVVDETKVTP
jgi:hypothetical protein